jgi:glycosyltransferase involved in cell wall biosynthesis
MPFTGMCGYRQWSMPEQTANRPSLSIFFPMFNEEENLHPAVDAARAECKTLIDNDEISSYELIIVNDASTDATGKLADELASIDRHVRVVHHPVNRKLGGSMKTGFASSTGDLILYSDADLPFDMDEVHKAVRLVRLYDADIVSAYRLDRTHEGYLRSVYTFFYNLLIRRWFGVRVRDVNFAFKLCRRSIFEDISLKSEGSFIDAELIIRASRHGYRIVQFGTDYFPRIRGESTLASPGVILTIVREMWQLRGELNSIGQLRR